MTLIDLILAEFDFEMSNTRVTLELIPQNKLGWKPHDKSFSFGELGLHLGNILDWTGKTVSGNSYNIESSDQENKDSFTGNSHKEIIDNFDKKSASARNALLKLTDEELTVGWTLLSGQKILFTLPKYFVIRQFIINHSIHHRAQLTVYLRLNNIPLPNLYGQTADEEFEPL